MRQLSVFKLFTHDKDSKECVLARKAAIDRIPISCLANSKNIRLRWLAQGYKLPVKAHDLTKMLKKFSDNMKNELKSNLEIRYKNVERFSMFTDEWTYIVLFSI